MRSSKSQTYLRPCPGGVELTVKVVPGASRDRVAGVLGDALKIQVAAPPERGKANAAVIGLLADILGLPEHHVVIVRGATNPRKTVRLVGVSPQAASAKLPT